MYLQPDDATEILQHLKQKIINRRNASVTAEDLILKSKVCLCFHYPVRYYAVFERFFPCTIFFIFRMQMDTIPCKKTKTLGNSCRLTIKDITNVIAKPPVNRKVNQILFFTLNRLDVFL